MDQYPVFGQWVPVAVTRWDEIRLNGFEPGIQYQFRVRAHNARGWGMWSAVTPAQKTHPSEPRAPRGITVTAVETTAMALEWFPPVTNGEAIEECVVMPLA